MAGVTLVRLGPAGALLICLDCPHTELFEAPYHLSEPAAREAGRVHEMQCKKTNKENNE